MRFLILSLLAGSMLALGSCSPGIPDDPDPIDDGTDPVDDNLVDCESVTLDGACAAGEKIGSFRVVEEEGYSLLSGQVADGIVPATILQKVSEDGNCVVLWEVAPACDPACPPGTTCDDDGTCIPAPSPVSVGTVAVKGLSQSLTLEPTGPGNIYSDSELPHPAFEPDACVELAAEGSDIDGFTLHGIGVTPLEIPEEPWVLRYDQPLTVSWTPSGDQESTIALTLSIDQPEVWPVTLLCNAEDNGSFTVPAEIVNAFMDFGFTDFAQGEISRQTVDSVETVHGCVEFKVLSHRQVALQVE
ncbi:MAG: hypothetical protein QUV05_20360 [Phycisphaerae bacterium]|nr:hypothetical protein [Phycisphaerae bacterium]